MVKIGTQSAQCVYVFVCGLLCHRTASTAMTARTHAKNEGHTIAVDSL